MEQALVTACGGWRRSMSTEGLLRKTKGTAETAQGRLSDHPLLLGGFLSLRCWMHSLTNSGSLPAHLEDEEDRSRRNAAAAFLVVCANIRELRGHGCILDGTRPTGVAAAVAVCLSRRMFSLSQRYKKKKTGGVGNQSAI